MVQKRAHGPVTHRLNFSGLIIYRPDANAHAADFVFDVCDLFAICHL